MGTLASYVPPGCTGIAQPLYVGIVGPLKHHLRRTELQEDATTVSQRRRDTVKRTLSAVASITKSTVINASKRLDRSIRADHSVGGGSPFGFRCAICSCLESLWILFQ
ncbi:TPA: hypothetical protein N0F65_009974 [Lagenidium giganteum]|uniref:Uncharacterized protein n=1 Tax=Lagenidium giganteum TaxID=4803 RepID=A0AAV2YVZ6_9STRA|nr:TPA: hypothetical protein N0F65_009974 [Lagenidium giganteum]